MNPVIGLLLATFAQTGDPPPRPPRIACTWRATDPLSCDKLESLDTSKAFTVSIAKAPAGTSLKASYWDQSSSNPKESVDCKQWNGGFACDPPQLPATGITLIAKANGQSRQANTPTSPPKKLQVSDQPPANPPELPQGHLSQATNEVLNKLVGVDAPLSLRIANDKDKQKLQETGYAPRRVGSGMALIVLNAAGQPLLPIPDVIDETDQIWVAVIDWKQYMSEVTLSVAGCNRPPVEVRVYGNDAKQEAASLRYGIKLKETSDSDAAQKVKLAEAADPLGVPVFQSIGKCAGADSGGPVVTVKAKPPGTQDAVSTSVSIPVNPVYRLVVGVGLGGDLTHTTSFGVTTVPGSTIATITETNDRIGLSALLWVGWYPLGRDFRKVDYFVQRLEVFVALDPQALNQSLIVGGGINLVTGMDLLVGWRALTKRTELPAETGLMTGSPFDGPASSLPTTKVWDTGGLFFGLGITNALLAKLH